MKGPPDTTDLPADLSDALAHFEVGGARITPLSHFGRAATYRLDLADGGRAKLRATLGGAAAAAQQRTLAALHAEHPGLRLSPVTDRAGRWLLEAWVDGDVVGDEPTGAAVDAAATLLASLHGIEHLGGTACHGAQPAGPIAAEAGDRVEALASEEVLDAGRAGGLADLLRTVPDGEVPTVLGHGDLCGTNLVRAPDGETWSVDNEAVGAIARPLDLALAWYRWPLEPPAFAHLLERYRHHARDQAGVEAASTDLPGWCAVAVAKGLWFRSRHRPDTLPFTLGRLDALLAEVAA